MKTALRPIFIRMSETSLMLLFLTLIIFSCKNNTASTTTEGGQDSVKTPLAFINTAFEKASPLDWEIDTNGSIVIGLTYDHRRSSPNRANGHWHFQIQAAPGTDLTLILKGFDNIWNGQKSSPISDRTSCYVWKKVQRKRYTTTLS